MAQPSIMHRFRLDVSDVDRGVYEDLDLRVAQHPSESPTWLVTRVLAFALEHHPDLAFGKGLSDAEEPALWVRDPTGQVQQWIELGQPSPERLHRASKKADRVVVYCQRDPATLAAEIQAAKVHRAEHLELVWLPPALVQDLVLRLTRANTWSVLHTEGVLYVTVDGLTLEGSPLRRGAA